MKTWQRILILSLLAVICIGMIIIHSVVVPQRANKVCNQVRVVIADSAKYQFLTPKGIETYIKNQGIYPIGKTIADIDLTEIERALNEINMVKTATAYFNGNGNLKIKITQRVPLFRVKTSNADFYVDTNRRRMPISSRHTVLVPIVTGSADEEFATGELYNFMEYIIESSRWATAFTQIHVYPNREIELIPRVGDFTIELGNLDRYPQKLGKLDIFLKKIPKYKSWDAYRTINLKYQDQVVCTRR